MATRQKGCNSFLDSRLKPLTARPLVQKFGVRCAFNRAGAGCNRDMSERESYGGSRLQISEALRWLARYPDFNEAVGTRDYINLGKGSVGELGWFGINPFALGPTLWPARESQLHRFAQFTGLRPPVGLPTSIAAEQLRATTPDDWQRQWVRAAIPQALLLGTHASAPRTAATVCPFIGPNQSWLDAAKRGCSTSGVRKRSKAFVSKRWALMPRTTSHGLACEARE